MDNLSKHIIYIAYKDFNGVNNLKLNKILCLSVLEYLKENNKPSDLLDYRGFYMLPYGIIHLSEYNKHKLYGRYGLYNVEGIYDRNLSFLDNYINKYLNMDIDELVTLSQSFLTWKNNIDYIMENGKFSIDVFNLY